MRSETPESNKRALLTLPAIHFIALKSTLACAPAGTDLNVNMKRGSQNALRQLNCVCSSAPVLISLR